MEVLVYVLHFLIKIKKVRGRVMEFIKNLNNNLNTLKYVSPFTWKWLNRNKEKIETAKKNTVWNKHGLWDFKYNNKLLMENYPLNHYFTWVREENIGVYIIIGSNVGYGITLLLKKAAPLSKIIVIEPNPTLLFACLGVVDYTPFIKQKRLMFLPPELELIRNFFDTLDIYIRHSKIKLLVDIPSCQIDNTYTLLGNKIKGIIENIKVSLTTAIKYQEEFVKNEIKNFYTSFSDGTLINLKKDNRKLYAFILGAGPSLKKFIPHLHKFKDKALFCTAFQTLPALYNLKFSPHLSMVIDFSKSLINVYNRLDNNFLKKIPLIYSPKVNPEVIKKYPGKRISIWTIGGIGTYIKKNLDIVIDSGGNVSIALIRLLSILGIKNFILVGQDFAWKGNKTHTEGHHASDVFFKFDEKKHIKLKNKYGETIYSAISYISAVRELEYDIKNQNIKVYNLYDGGIEIEGSKEINLDDLNELISQNYSSKALKTLLNEIKSNNTKRYVIPILPLESKEWISSLNSVEKRLNKLFKKPGQNRVKINSVYRELCIFLGQHPLYQPYIYNEILTISKYAFIKGKYEPIDLVETKKILKHIKYKIKEMYLILKK